MNELDRLFRDQLIERVPVDTNQAASWLADARRHVEAASQISDRDPIGAHLLAYDAARKAVVGHMAAVGLRTRSVPGAHWAVARYARTLGEDTALSGLDTLRRVRNGAEYGGRQVGRAQARHAIVLAERIIVIVTAELT